MATSKRKELKFLNKLLPLELKSLREKRSSEIYNTIFKPPFNTTNHLNVKSTTSRHLSRSAKNSDTDNKTQSIKATVPFQNGNKNAMPRAQELPCLIRKEPLWLIEPHLSTSNSTKEPSKPKRLQLRSTKPKLILLN